MWGCEDSAILERLQLKFYKYLLGLNKSTCSSMVYGELGVFPLEIAIKTRLLTFWAKLIKGNTDKLSFVIYSLLYRLHVQDVLKCNWLSTVESVLNNAGFSGFWIRQSIPCSLEVFKNKITLRLRDIFIQHWREDVSRGAKCTIYRVIKKNFCLENYLLTLPSVLKRCVLKFRCRNHRLPIESGCRALVLRDMRTCPHCKRDVGDEFHYLLACPYFNNERRQFLQRQFWKNPSTLKLESLFENTSLKFTVNLANFIKIILNSF